MVPLSDYILGRAVPLIYIYRYEARIIRVISQPGGLKPYYTILSRPFLSPQLHPEEWDDHRKLDLFTFDHQTLDNGDKIFLTPNLL